MVFFCILVSCRFGSRGHCCGETYSVCSPENLDRCLFEILASTSVSTQHQDSEEHHKVI
jgi:hypothetical protein